MSMRPLKVFLLDKIATDMIFAANINKWLKSRSCILGMFEKYVRFLLEGKYKQLKNTPEIMLS